MSDVPAPPRWGLGDCVVGLVPAGLGALAVLGAAGGDPGEPGAEDISLVALAVSQLFLWAFLGGVPLLASVRKGAGPVADFGLRFKPTDMPLGLAIGVAAQAIVIPLLYIPILELFGSVDDTDVCADAKELTDAATGLGVVVLVLLVAVAAPFFEELFYRGLLLRSIDKRFGPVWALAGSSVVFAASHLQGIQFPALLVFGLLAGWLAQRTGRLGLSVFAHVGFNAWTLFVLMALDGC